MTEAGKTRPMALLALLSALSAVPGSALADVGPACEPDGSGAPGVSENIESATTPLNAYLNEAPPDQRVIGHPNSDGARITGASELPRNGTGYFQRGFRPGRNFGSFQLVRLIENATFDFHHFHDGYNVHVGDLSQRNGGRIQPHGSHRNGLDADVDYVRAENGTFDDIGSLELLQSFVESPGNIPDYNGIHTIFVGASIKNRLCRAARRSGRMDEFALTLSHLEIHNGHTSHFHVRINCPENQNRCRLRQRGHNAARTGCN